MTTATIEYLRELVALNGPSGSEEDVVRAVARLARPLVDTVELDAMGNLIAVRQAASQDARCCLLAAHMDEVGFRIAAIDPDGFLRFEKVGGFDDRILLAQRVRVRTQAGQLLGVIGTRSAHLLREEDRRSVQPYSSLYIDIGARSADDARQMGVRIGDSAGFVADLAELGRESGRYTAHALDDRAGCAIVLGLLDRFRDSAPPVTIVALFTVQEEVGLRGAHAAARGDSGYDLALAVDMTALDDTPEIGTKRLRLGAGPAIKVMDAQQLAHPAIQRAMLAAAERAGLSVQREILPGIGTDAGALQYSGRGVPAGALSVGNRYTHSPVEVLDEGDLEGAVRLLHELALALPEADLRFTTLD